MALLAVHIVVQAVGLLHQTVLDDHLVVLAEGVGSGGLQPVGPGGLDRLGAGHGLQGRIEVVVIAVHADQASVALLAVHVVVQAVVLPNQTIFDDHFAVLTELVGSGGLQTVGSVSSDRLGAGHGSAVLADVVVVVIDLDQTGVLADALSGDIVQPTVRREDEPGLLDHTVQNAVGSEIIQRDRTIGHAAGADALIPVTALIEAIGLAVDLRELERRAGLAVGSVVAGAVIVAHPLLHLHPDAVDLAVLFKEVIRHLEAQALARHGVSVVGTEVIVFAVDLLPAVGGGAVDRVVPDAAVLGEAGVFPLQNTCIVKAVEVALTVILIAGQLVHTSDGGAVDVVLPGARVTHPAVMEGAVQTILIGEFDGLVRIAGEVCAVVQRVVLAVVIGEEAVVDLILLLRRQILQNMEVRVDVIVELAGDLHLQLIGLHRIPGRSIGGRELDAADHTQRVRGGGVDRLGLQFEVRNDLERIVLVIDAGEIEILIDDLEIRVIELKALGNVNVDRDGRQRADTLRQLQQE